MYFSERCKCKPIRATQKTYFRNNYNYGKDNFMTDLKIALCVYVCVIRS